MASSMLAPETSAPGTGMEANMDEAMNTSLRSCANDPNFAVICSFLQKFANDLGLNVPSFKHLQEWLTRTDEVSPQLRDMQIKLLRKTRKIVHEKSWETALSKFCFVYSAQDAWEVERFGYKNAGIKVKLRILRELLESQFERNSKFRSKISTQSADSLRSKPVGRDRLGHAYWVTQDQDCNLRIYQEHLDEDTWQVVATNREEFVNLITRLRGNEVVLPSANIGVVDEDTSSSNSCSEINQKPPPPEEKDDSQEDEQKVPKLSIKLFNGKSPNKNESNEIGKGEEELAAEEDAKLNKVSNKDGESCDEEFEEVEEEYEEEDDSNEDEAGIEIETPDAGKSTKTVKPLLISQNKIKNSTSDTTGGVSRKRTIDEVIIKSPLHDDEYKQTSEIKKSRPSLLDSKKSSKSNKYDEHCEGGEENYVDSTDDDEDVDEEVEEEDIDSAAAEEDENEEKQIEDFDDDDNNSSDVGEEITDPVFRIQGDGSGKDCEAGDIWGNMEQLFEDDSSEVGEVLGEILFCVQGEGTGKGCLVGNVQPESKTVTEEAISVATAEVNANNGKIIDDQHENDSKVSSELINKADDNSKKSIKISELNDAQCSTSSKDVEHKKTIAKGENQLKVNSENENKEEPVNGENVSSEIFNLKSDVKIEEPEIKNEPDPNSTPQKLELNATSSESSTVSEAKKLNNEATEASEHNNGSKMSALETLKKELRESKQKSLELKSVTPITSANISAKTLKTNAATWNRKRRLEGFTSQQSQSGRTQNSESEIDLNSEITEEICKEQEDLEINEQDVGGKRLKMRPKQNNTELRKKIEAQKAAGIEETTSSSGEEESRRRRKIISPKRRNTDVLNKTNEIAEISLALSSATSKPNGQNSNEPNDKKEEVQSKDSSPQQPSTSQLKPQASNIKQKATLSEIIEKKLKRIPVEEISKESSPPLDIKLTITKPLYSPPKKCPVTKPLKKNLLTQIRQEESEEEAIPRKRTISEDHTSAGAVECKTSIANVTPDVQRITPERQRKRRSSEETASNSLPEEPGAKKEVSAKVEEPKSNKEKTVEDESQCKKFLNETQSNDKEETIADVVPEVSRRSGRRGVAAVVTETPQAKRTRGSIKSSPKIELKEEKKDYAEMKETIEESVIPSVKSETEEDSSSDIEYEDSKTKLPKRKEKTVVQSEKDKKTNTKKIRKKRDIDTTNIIVTNDSETPVRQSRRIAQQKIREEAERRKLEEIALRTMKQELKKKKKAEKQTDFTIVLPSESSSESEESDVETKKKAQKKKCPGKNGSWSSGSEEQEEPDEEEEEEHHRYETDPGSPLFKSDHEFSPESDLEDETQAVPMKRARTARKEDTPGNDLIEEENCQKCNKSDHPEWILLCDKCDNGYHCSCLSPVLFYIPEGNWYCPPCQQEQLIAALENQLKKLDELVERKKIEAEEEKRLADEEKTRKEEEDRKLNDLKESSKAKQRHNQNSSDDEKSRLSQKTEGSSDHTEDSDRKKESNKDSTCNRSKKHEKRNRYEKRQKSSRRTRTRARNRSSTDSRDLKQSGSSLISSSILSSSFSDSDNEPIYKLRKRRQINVFYRINEYDDLINSAVKKEMDEAAGAGNLGRGKDISTIIEADKEEKARQKQVNEEEDGNPLDDPSKSTESKEKGELISSLKSVENEDNKDIKTEKPDSGDEVLSRKPRHKQSLKKKSRKLTTLDFSSEDDNGSDEDFKGSSIEDEEEDTSISASSNSDSSLEIYKRKGKSKKKQRKVARRAFRERRKDRKFIVDESDEDEDVQRPKTKKKRKVESDYTESEIDDDDISELSENLDSADLCDDTSTDESDGAWRPNKRKKSKKTKAPSAVATKEISTKHQQAKKSKKVEYSDDDVTESEEDIDDDDDEPLGVGGGKQPRSQPLKTTPKAVKTKGKSKPGTTSKTKKKRSSDDSQSFSDDSGDSTRRTRGRRYAYIEEFEDDSSDGGIKPGVQRPDTPPEEREKFIKRQEEIKRMLAEKNAEGAKLAATPRLTPIKSDLDKDKRSPSKVGSDSLSTVPLSVIRQAKVLDIDYLQRRGENLDELSNDVDDVGDDFDDADLPDDLPEDMDEDAIARMVEEEEEFNAAASRDLPAPDEVLRTPSVPAKPKQKENDKVVVPIQTSTYPTVVQSPSVQGSTSGLQEPVRKRLPMPTMHPPLLRHQLFAHEPMNSAGQHIIRHTASPASHLLQSALSAPLGASHHRSYPPPPHSLINRMPQNMAVPPSGAASAVTSCRTSAPAVKTTPPPQGNVEQQDKYPIINKETESKPRGRRKKITPLRDTLQKQQTAAAVAAAASASTAASTAAKIRDLLVSAPSSVIKPCPPNKVQMQASVITSLQHPSHSFPSTSPVSMPPSGGYPGPEGFYRHPGVRLPPPNTQRHRGPHQIPTSLLTSHPNMRPSYGPPPPLKGGHMTGSTSSANPSNIRGPPNSHMGQYVGGGAPTARHSGSHLNIYGPSIYGNPNFGPRGSLRPPPIHSSQYPTGSRAYPPYGFYPPPPPLTTPPPQTPRAAVQQPTSVIVSNTLSASSKHSSAPAAPTSNLSDIPNKSISVKTEFNIKSSPKSLVSGATKTSPEPIKKLTTLETYTNSETDTNLALPLTSEISRSKTSPSMHVNLPGNASPTSVAPENPPAANEQQTDNEGPASEFSGLVSYFSSQHDDYNT